MYCEQIVFCLAAQKRRGEERSLDPGLAT